MNSTNSIVFVIGLSAVTFCACSGGSGTGLLPDPDQGDAASGTTGREDSSDGVDADSGAAVDDSDTHDLMAVFDSGWPSQQSQQIRQDEST